MSLEVPVERFLRRELVELHKLAYRAENQGSPFGEALRSGEEENLTEEEVRVMRVEAAVELAAQLVFTETEGNLGLE